MCSTHEQTERFPGFGWFLALNSKRWKLSNGKQLTSWKFRNSRTKQEPNYIECHRSAATRQLMQLIGAHFISLVWCLSLIEYSPVTQWVLLTLLHFSKERATGEHSEEHKAMRHVPPGMQIGECKWSWMLNTLSPADQDRFRFGSQIREFECLAAWKCFSEESKNLAGLWVADRRITLDTERKNTDLVSLSSDKEVGDLHSACREQRSWTSRHLENLKTKRLSQNSQQREGRMLAPRFPLQNR